MIVDELLDSSSGLTPDGLSGGIKHHDAIR
jgi:hypothetical protein